jgi:hypothetical protein
MFSQLEKWLMPVAAQFRTDLAILKSFNSSLTV